ncbi:MAG TPA: DUF1735 domain-containing protein [Flavisolibacter sp.]|nr:DUF1735 domain-containing protein [Flavisolibacter sp.]
MKKFITKALFAVALGIVGTGCLKDKGFEDQQYGTKIEDIKAVAFPQAATSPVEFGLTAVPTAQSMRVAVALEADQAASGPVTVNLVVNNALLPSGLTAAPANSFTIPTSVTIPAGQKIAYIDVAVPNATVFDPNLKYGIGISIASVTEGYKIAANQKNVVLGISIKNKYDGVYEITGTLQDANGAYTGDYGDPQFPRIYEMSTTGPGSILFYDLSWDYPNYIVVSISTGGGANTGIRPEFTFNTTNDQLVSAINKANGQALTIGAGSKFNPADRSFDIKWSLGRWTITEHWKFLRDR